jgi:pimeloyl-ACP methyl ester carboxylesterase
LVSTLSDRSREISVPTSAGITVRDVTLRNGVRLGYAERGPRLGPVVLMLHGYTDSWFSFSRVLPLLPKDLRVFALDQRGHGDSDRPATGYSIDHLAADAVQFMDALTIASATIVGHSMGSFVARRMAERAPSRVGRLIVVGSACTARTPALAELAQTVNVLTDPVDEEFVRRFRRARSAARCRRASCAVSSRTAGGCRRGVEGRAGRAARIHTSTVPPAARRSSSAVRRWRLPRPSSARLSVSCRPLLHMSPASGRTGKIRPLRALCADTSSPRLQALEVSLQAPYQPLPALPAVPDLPDLPDLPALLIRALHFH